MSAGLTTHSANAALRAWMGLRDSAMRLWRRIHSEMRRSRSTLYICYALIGLYAVPLIVILWVLFRSDGFTRSDAFIEYGIALASLYAAETRETLATFVMPFVTAYAVATAQRDGSVPARTLYLFFTLVALFGLAVIVYCAVTTRIDLLLGQSNVNQEIASAAKLQIPQMCKLYLKELLVYISLTVGIAQSGRANRPPDGGPKP